MITKEQAARIQQKIKDFKADLDNHLMQEGKEAEVRGWMGWYDVRVILEDIEKETDSVQ